MAHCTHCDKEVEPIRDGKRYRCPDCHLYVKASKEEKTEPLVEEIKEEITEEPFEKSKLKKKDPPIIQEGPKKLLPTSKSIMYDAADLHMGEILINLGYARDLNDLTRKNMKLAFSLMNMGAVGKQFNAMETNQEPDPGKTMKEIQQQKLMEAYINSMNGGNSKIDPMSMMMMMRMMENQGKEKDVKPNGLMDKMLEIQMMKSVMGGQNSDTASLQSQIAELKHGMQMQQLMNQQQQQQQGNQSSQEFMQQMEKIRAERDQSIKKAEVDAQNERDKNLQLAFDNRKVELENRLQAMEKDMKKGSGNLVGSKIKEMKDEIAAVKEISTLLGDKEKGTGEMVMDGLGKVVENVVPTLVELGKQRQQQQMYQQQTPPPEQLPQELPPQQLNPEPQNSLGLTPTEQQMSDQYSDMYIHSSEKK